MSAVNVATTTIPTDPATVAREKILQDYRKKLLEHKELEARLKESKLSFRYLLKWYDGRHCSLLNQNCLVMGVVECTVWVNTTSARSALSADN